MIEPSTATLLAAVSGLLSFGLLHWLGVEDAAPIGMIILIGMFAVCMGLAEK